ncbi:MAG: hypothetical protein Tsb009_17360 [Planctomycetaceae bacterium]
MATQRELTQATNQLAKCLIQLRKKIVFAESCTGGLISASLTRIPGISSYLCGSAVVYRIDTKARWLGIERSVLEKPGPVSRAVAQAMSEAVLLKTPEADVASSITGHLGPDVPKNVDGLIYVGVSTRIKQKRNHSFKTTVIRHRLASADSSKTVHRRRLTRQREAARFAMMQTLEILERISFESIEN